MRFVAKILRDAEAGCTHKKVSVAMERTLYELRGVPCIPLEEQPPNKDQLIFSRSFSHPVATPEAMQQVPSIYAQRASSRLREHDLVTCVVSAWASTSRFREGEFHTAHTAVGMPTETDDPIGIAKAAFTLLPKVRPGSQYVRAGIVLTGLRKKANVTPLALFEPEYEGRRIGEVLDEITAKLGSRAIGVGRGGLKGAPAWTMKREMLSRRATTHWNELCEARALKCSGPARISCDLRPPLMKKRSLCHFRQRERSITQADQTCAAVWLDRDAPKLLFMPIPGCPKS